MQCSSDSAVASSSSVAAHLQMQPVPVVRVVKRRTTANKKERRRTQSINNAFSDLRDCIPNVPSDTKLSKIKTLRLATSYIGYLMEVLDSDDPDTDGFKADLSAHMSRRSSTATAHAVVSAIASAVSAASRSKTHQQVYNITPILLLRLILLKTCNLFVKINRTNSGLENVIIIFVIRF